MKQKVEGRKRITGGYKVKDTTIGVLSIKVIWNTNDECLKGRVRWGDQGGDGIAYGHKVSKERDNPRECLPKAIRLTLGSIP